MRSEEGLEDEAYFEAWSREALVALLEVRRHKLVAQAEVEEERDTLKATLEQALDCLEGSCPILHDGTDDGIARRLRQALEEAERK